MGKLFIPKQVVVGLQIRDLTKKADYGGRELPNNPKVQFTDIELRKNEYFLAMFLPKEAFIAQDKNFDKWNKWRNKSIIPLETANDFRQYKIVSVLRHSTSGMFFTSGKIRWRVENSIGFQFEITGTTLANLIQDCTIKNGVIQEGCVQAFSPTITISIVSSTSPSYLEYKRLLDKKLK